MKVVRREVEVRVVEKVVVVVVERDERGRLVVIVVNLVAVEVWVERDGIVRELFVFCTWERGWGGGFMTDDCGG